MAVSILLTFCKQNVSKMQRNCTAFCHAKWYTMHFTKELSVELMAYDNRVVSTNVY